MLKLGERLKLLRKINNKTQSEIGAIIGVGKTAVSNYENGKTMPSTQKIVVLAKYFGVDVAYLTGEKNRMHEPGGKYAAAKKVALVSAQTAMNLPEFIASEAEKYVEAPIKSASNNTFAVKMVECDIPVTVVAERKNYATEFVLCGVGEALRILKREDVQSKGAQILGGVLFFI